MHQPGILDDVPQAARYLTFDLHSPAGAAEGLRRLAAQLDGDAAVLGIGLVTVNQVGAHIDGLREAPPLVGADAAMPSTPAALWCWLRGDDRGTLLYQSRAIRDAASPAFVVREVIDAFQYADSRDLSGYVDGTENPTDHKAQSVALTQDGASFAFVQRWEHDLTRFHGFPTAEQDHIIGRRITDNAEIETAPKSAHVKRTAQEDFAPEAFVLRRSMPWSEPQMDREGLNFVAFGRHLDPSFALSRRMVGLDDGITDALFRFTRPLSTATFWCPPVRNGALDLRPLGL